jgi:hypothetical protein
MIAIHQYIKLLSHDSNMPRYLPTFTITRRELTQSDRESETIYPVNRIMKYNPDPVNQKYLDIRTDDGA